MITQTQQLTTTANLDQVTNQLQNWLVQQLNESALAWLDQTIQQLLESASERVLFTRFSATSRQVGKADLALTEEDLKTAHRLRAGWMPRQWSIDQAARTLLLLQFPSADADRYANAVEKLFSAADVAEQVALYQSLPLLPHPERFKARAIEGLRTNIKVVFNAIVLHNPYPADYFDEAAWNQMVLKAIFVESYLSQIQKLDERANAALARMLSDYAHERWAAKRSVNSQLWRAIGPFVEGALISDLSHVLLYGDSVEKAAAALACARVSTPEAQSLLDSVPVLKQQIASQQLTWESLSQSSL